jgi:hypothetical protein
LAAPSASGHGIEDVAAEAALRDIFTIIDGLLGESGLDSEIEGLLWSFVNALHSRVTGQERRLAGIEAQIKAAMAEQDGSEVRSAGLEALLEEARTAESKIEALTDLRDAAESQFTAVTGSLWRPRAGSVGRAKALTASMIEARDFLEASRNARHIRHFPDGVRIAVTGGAAFEDHALIWERLDKVRAKHGAIVLLHGGGRKGAEHIAALWAKTRSVPQVIFKPDWSAHGRAAPFKRNDAIVSCLPVGLVLFPGGGIAENLAQKAQAQGIPVWRCSGTPA